jgi:hypothetical protein
VPLQGRPGRLGPRQGRQCDAVTRAQHPVELCDRRPGAIQEDENEVAGGGVEAPVPAREGLDIARDEGHTERREPIPGARGHRRRHVEGQDPGGRAIALAAAAATGPVPVPTSRKKSPASSAQAARRSGTNGSDTRAIARSYPAAMASNGTDGIGAIAAGPFSAPPASRRAAVTSPHLR